MVRSQMQRRDLPLTASSSVNLSIDTADSDTESRRASSSATLDLTDMPPLLSTPQ